MCIQLVLLLSGRGRIHVERRHLRVVPEVMWSMCRMSGTGLLQMLLTTTSWIGLVRVIAIIRQRGARGVHDRHPHDPVRVAAVVGAGECRRDDGRSGAGCGEARARGAAVWIAGFYNMIFLGLVGSMFMAFAPAIVVDLHRDPAIAGT